MYRGYIKLFRKTIDSVVFTNPELLKVWIWCLFNANHKEKWFSINTGRGFTEIQCKQGEFITGRSEASRQLQLSPSKTRNLLRKLQKFQNIELESSNFYTKIKVLNYSDYQQVAEDVEQATTKQQPNNSQQSTNNRPSIDHQSTTTNNDKNNKNVKNDNNNTGLRLFKNDKLYNFDNFKKSFINSKYENADLEFYHEAVMNWADSNGTKKKDWAATARNFMLRDLKDNKLKLKNGVKQITEEDREFNRWVEDNLNN